MVGFVKETLQLLGRFHKSHLFRWFTLSKFQKNCKSSLIVTLYPTPLLSLVEKQEDTDLELGGLNFAQKSSSHFSNNENGGRLRFETSGIHIFRKSVYILQNFFLEMLRNKASKS